MRLVKREAGSEAEDTLGMQQQLLDVAEEPFRAPSAIQALLTSCAGLPTEERVALVRAHAQEVEAPVWPPSPPDGSCLEFAPVLESPGARKRLKREIEIGRMSSPVKRENHSWPRDEVMRNGEEEEEEDSGGTWMPAGDGGCRSSDARVYFAVTQASVPSTYCRHAFPCPATFAPCVPVGHVARGKLELSQDSGRLSFVLDLEIVSGGCRPLYVVKVSAGVGAPMLRFRHSQPSQVLQMVMMDLLDEAVPRITDDVAATFFGLDLPAVHAELAEGWARRQRELATTAIKRD